MKTVVIPYRHDMKSILLWLTLTSFLFSCGIKTNTEITNKAKSRQTNQMKLNSNTDQEQIQLILERMNLCSEGFVKKCRQGSYPFFFSNLCDLW